MPGAAVPTAAVLRQSVSRLRIGGCDGQNCGAITIVGGTIRVRGTSGLRASAEGRGYSGAVRAAHIAPWWRRDGIRRSWRAGIGCGEGGAESMVDISTGGIVTAAVAVRAGHPSAATITRALDGQYIRYRSCGRCSEQLPGIIGSPPRATATLLPRSGSITGSNTVVITDLIHSNIACEGGLIATNGRGRLLSDHVSIPHS